MRHTAFLVLIGAGVVAGISSSGQVAPPGSFTAAQAARGAQLFEKQRELAPRGPRLRRTALCRLGANHT